MAIWSMNIGDCRGVEGVAARVRSLSVCGACVCMVRARHTDLRTRNT